MRFALLTGVMGLSALCFVPAVRAGGGQDDDKTEVKDGKDDDNDQDEHVAVSDLPKAVVDATTAAQSGGKITEADKEEENGAVVYSLNVTNNGKKYEIKVDASGNVISNKVDDDDDDGDGETNDD